MHTAGERSRTHEVVVRHIEEQLRHGALRVGERLPGERALAEQLNISRPSIREGIRVLEAIGLVRTAVGSGPEAGAIVINEAAAGLTTTLRLHLAASSLPVADLVETRSLIESWSVREAARRQRAAELTAAGELLRAMDDRGLSPRQFHLLDADFHVTLARAAGNDVVSVIMRSLRDSINGYVLAAIPNLPDWAAMARRLRREHKAIHAAIEAGDGELAAQKVVAHINGFHRATLRVESGGAQAR
jgi:GntR family transcriptional repressor for pyruvate dehydrogenase complex